MRTAGPGDGILVGFAVVFGERGGGTAPDGAQSMAVGDCMREGCKPDRAGVEDRDGCRDVVEGTLPNVGRVDNVAASQSVLCIVAVVSASERRLWRVGVWLGSAMFRHSSTAIKPH